jgi:WD domain, G-beta repeat
MVRVAVGCATVAADACQQVVRVLPGHGFGYIVYSLAYSPEGALLASASDDRRVEHPIIAR